MEEIAQAKETMPEQKKQAVMEQLWLTYYNDTLYARGLLTEDQHNRMRVMLKNRCDARKQ